MKVRLIDSKRNKHTFPAGFSFWYLFFGPFYTIIRGKIIYSTIVLLYYFIMVPKNIFVTMIEKIISDENIINILAYPHINLDIITVLLLTLVPHIIMCIYIDNYFLKEAINKNNMLPASDVDLEKLTKISKKYKDLPIDSSFIEGLILVKPETMDNFSKKEKSVIALDSNNILSEVQRTKNERLDEVKQHQLDILYGKYNLGLISESELIETKAKILNEKN